MRWIFEDEKEIVKRETKEPDWDTYSEYFEEVLEGRSIKSVVKTLRKDGYSVSETTVRARFREWQAYKRVKENLEIEINYIKGEILEKIRITQEEIEKNINQRSLKTQEAFEKLINYVERKLNEFEYRIDEKLDEIETNQRQKLRNLEYNTQMLKKAIDQIITGIQKKGKLESLREAIEREITEDVYNFLNY